MIFVTVGTQLPFDRLLAAVDAFALRHPDVAVLAQVGETRQPPRHVDWVPFLSAAACEQAVREAELVVAHAGMGSVLAALAARKPLVVMPRRADLGEHRNEHQAATAKWLAGRAGVRVAWDASEVSGWLERRAEIAGGPGLRRHADPQLMARLRGFLFVGTTRD